MGVAKSTDSYCVARNFISDLAPWFYPQGPCVGMGYVIQISCSYSSIEVNPISLAHLALISLISHYKSCAIWVIEVFVCVDSNFVY